MNAPSPKHGSIILEAKEIKKSFLFRNRPSVVLEAVNFLIHEGEFVSILGSSGCGKSTFLELLAGVSKPDSGTILYRNMDITAQTGYLGYMPQEDLLFPWLSVLQNILIPVRVKGRDLKLATRQVNDLLPLFGLENHAHHHPHQLSGGLKQRVALLRTYMTGSPLLLLDEPLASLDSLTRSQLQDWLKTIVSELQLTIILVTHDIDEAMQLSDRVELMCKDPGSFIQSIPIPSDIQADELGKQALKSRIKGLFYS